LKESEKALTSKLELFAETQYPELRIQAPKLFEEKPSTLASKNKLAQYSELTPVSSDTLLSTAPNGDKVVVKKYPIPSEARKKYCQKIFSFLAQ